MLNARTPRRSSSWPPRRTARCPPTSTTAWSLASGSGPRATRAFPRACSATGRMPSPRRCGTSATPRRTSRARPAATSPSRGSRCCPRRPTSPPTGCGPGRPEPVLLAAGHGLATSLLYQPIERHDVEQQDGDGGRGRNARRSSSGSATGRPGRPPGGARSTTSSTSRLRAADTGGLGWLECYIASVGERMPADHERHRPAV